MDVRLVQLGEYGGRETPVEREEFVVGREISSDLRIDHGKVSIRHCRIIKRGGRVMVEDLNSTNGTVVNDQPLDKDPIEVHDGDVLRVGPSQFRFVIRTGSKDIDARIGGMVDSAPPHPGAVPVTPSDSGITGMSAAVESAKHILERLQIGKGKEEPATSRPEGGKRHWVEVAESPGNVAVVRVMPRSVVDEREVRRLSEAIENVIDSGKSRIALNLGNVEHLSSQAVGAMVQAHRRCQASGGALKICTVRPNVAEIFSMTNLHRHIEIHDEEGLALRAPWPAAAPAAKPATAPPKPADAPAPAGLRAIRLIVEVGRSKGQAIEVKGAKFVIGRDPKCQLRPSSELISRLHALIEQREGKVFVRDLGTKNGTILNDRALHGEEAEATNGDRLQVGLLQFTLSIADRPLQAAAPAAKPEDDALAFLLGENRAIDPDASTLFFLPTSKAPPADSPAPSRPAEPEAKGPSDAEVAKGLHHVSLERLADILVVSPLTPDLGDESTVAPLRYDLQTVVDRAHPHRVVVSLEHVRSISQRAIGTLLALSQRIERAGGTLRFSDASPEVVPTLEAMRLHELADLYDNRAQAIADPWP